MTLGNTVDRIPQCPCLSEQSVSGTGRGRRKEGRKSSPEMPDFSFVK